MTRKLLAKHLFLIAVLSAYSLVLHFSGLHCPILALTGYPCPTCGMTRALLALAALDVENYVRFHPLALPILAAVLAGIHSRLLNRRAVGLFVVAVAAASAFLYVCRLIFGFPF